MYFWAYMGRNLQLKALINVSSKRLFWSVDIINPLISSSFFFFVKFDTTELQPHFQPFQKWIDVEIFYSVTWNHTSL